MGKLLIYLIKILGSWILLSQHLLGFKSTLCVPFWLQVMLIGSGILVENIHAFNDEICFQKTEFSVFILISHCCKIFIEGRVSIRHSQDVVVIISSIAWVVYCFLASIIIIFICQKEFSFVFCQGNTGSVQIIRWLHFFQKILIYSRIPVSSPSKKSPSDIIHLCQRFSQSLKHFWYAFFGMSLSSLSDSVFISSIVLKCCPLIGLFNLGNK